MSIGHKVFEDSSDTQKIMLSSFILIVAKFPSAIHVSPGTSLKSSLFSVHGPVHSPVHGPVHESRVQVLYHLRLARQVAAISCLLQIPARTQTPKYDGPMGASY